MRQNGCFFYRLCFLVIFFQCVFCGDKESLLRLKSSIDPTNSLKWNGSDVCKWDGVKECLNGRVSKLVLENKNLQGTLDSRILNELDQIRVLSFKQNSLFGKIPNLSGLQNLKSLFLSFNNFSGDFPASLTTLHRLKTIVLSSNQLSGDIPSSILNVQRLYVLYLDNNRFTGKIPPLNQSSLKFLNLSSNQLSGQIPATPVLVRFNSTSFSGNVDLCGDAFNIPCNITPTPSFSPANPPLTAGKSHRHRKIKKIAIIAGSVGGFLLLCLLVTLLALCIKKTQKNKSPETATKKSEIAAAPPSAAGAASSSGKTGDTSGDDGGGGIGKLVFFGGGDSPEMSYSLEDLLKASAETLGRGTVGSTYKAVMESGFIVTVKRLKDARYPRVEEFRRHVDVIGRLRHQNLVPLRAYFHAKEERLLVYDYFPNGSLFSLIHGSRTSAGGKPLHWTSCLKIAEDLATGLLYIHQNPGLTHGNLKSSNVLLGSDFESCLTDYGLMTFRNPDYPEEASASSLFYRAPECRDPRKPLTQQADVYSFGVLLLELLTGKTPFQDLVMEHGSDIPKWVKSVREEETESGDEPTSSGNEASEEKLTALLNIAMACISLVPENRPVMKEVLRMIRETRAEAAIVSSNSSDHSPGRWSDTVQSLPRDEHLSI
uniref:inactive leucine-rich repeat receptor-like serine/threonine-protein kinase At1g60630 n=1 Tax=Erigeron canadensis TaxID=72917 RepID=UPI001CB90AA4|nr:inactive leucine-rich repeat receptor-like serine/threonine-protein kinase At1g60630 [Erigeron canadensis]